MRQLWESPKSISTILLNADKGDIKKNMANFIVHNLYDNISSLHQKDEQLIYIITLLLKEEINSLTNINTFFLYETCGGFLLKEFKKRKEVKFFFKNVILKIIERFEKNYPSEKIVLDTKEIREMIKSSSTKNQQLHKTKINRKEDKKFELFNQNYLYRLFNKDNLCNELVKYKDKDMLDYLLKKINGMSSPNQYLNETFLQDIAFDKDFDKIMEYYKNSFFQVIDIIDLFFESLLNNIDLCPYSIKCFCKIISILIKKKFPKSIKVEQNRFLIIFFFQYLLFPMLIDPSLDLLINEYFISDSIKQKIKTIISILNKLLRGILYEKSNLTPFNWYIIEKMPKILDFFNKLCQVSLPNFIDKLLNDKLPENYEYEYFKENPNKNFLYRNICFNIDELYSLVMNAEKCKNNISIDKVILNKFKIYIKDLEKLKNKEEFEELHTTDIRYDIIERKKIIKYFLLTDLISNKKFDKLLTIKNNKKNHFTLKELKKIETEEQKIKNDISKVKNFIYALLYNYQILSKNEYKVENLSNFNNILKELKAKSSISSSIYMDNRHIPLDWYINSLMHYLPKLPEKYKINDYEELLNEIENEITNSIKELNFEILTNFIEYYKEAQKEKIYNQKVINILNDLDINRIVEDIINEEKIYFDLNKDDKINLFFLNIMQEFTEFSNLFLKNEEETKMQNDIKSFINQIPYFDKNILDIEDDFFKLLKDKKIPEIIQNYYTLIKKNLKGKKFGNEKKLNAINNKIYDYIMEQLYDKLYPKQLLIQDIQIYKNCYKHIWIEFQNLIKENKNYIFNDYLPKAINFFKQFQKEKSPRKKLICLQEIFNCNYNLAKFNGDEMKGADDEMPLLNYSLIQSKPENIYSSCKYTELFLGEKALEIEGIQLIQIIGICQKMQNISLKDFYNIAESYYIYNCDMVNKGLIY